MNDSNDPWYRNGLQFECTRCGDCCAGTPGFVWVELDEIQRLADFLKLSLDEFGRSYLRRVGDQISLIETRESACIFWDSNTGCQVYESRPNQCQTWPFWPENLRTPEDWERTKRVCPGSGQGTFVSLESIKVALARSSE